MIDKILSTIGNSKTSQKFFKWASQPDAEKFLNSTLPQIETAAATSCYIYSTAKQKNIDDDRKKLLQLQNIGSGVVGITIASTASRAVGKFGEKVIENLDTDKVNPDSIKRISTGIRVGLPIMVTSFCMRFLVPSCIALFSGKIMDKVRNKRNDRLDVKA